MWRDDALLLDMLLAARSAAEYTRGKTWDDFAADEMLQSATKYQLQVIGEAAAKVSAERQKETPEIPWLKVIAFRHRLVHDYKRIDLPKVWTIVQEHLVPFIEVLERRVPPDEGAPDRP